MRAHHPFASQSAPARAGGAFSSRPMRPRSRRSHAFALLATLSVCLALSADAATLYLEMPRCSVTTPGRCHRHLQRPTAALQCRVQRSGKMNSKFKLKFKSN